MLLSSCATRQNEKIATIGNNSSINLLYQGDSNLAGIVIDHDDPVGLDNVATRNKNSHPRFISYYFWDGMVDYIEYDKNGVVLNTHKPSRLTPITKPTWLRVDFSYGSDPKFKRHQDPRK